jgi:hypothetical protein
MTATWKTVLRFDVPQAPAHHTITAWGRQCRVVPARPSTRAEVLHSDVVRVEVVGPVVAPSLEPPGPEDVIHVDLAEDLNNDITRVGEAPADVLELVYEVATEEEGDITAVTPNPMLERTRVDTLRNRNTESRHG